MSGWGPLIAPFEVERLETIVCAMDRMVDIAGEIFDGIVVGGGSGFFVRTENAGTLSSRSAWERMPVSHLSGRIKN